MAENERNERSWTPWVVVVFSAGFTALIVLQCVTLMQQWSGQRMVMMVLASQQPTAQLEEMLQKYFMEQKTVKKNKKGASNE